MNLEKYIGCSQAARKQIKADLVLKNASIVNVFTDRVERGNIAIKNGIIVGIGDFKGEEELDIGGQYVTSGFIDAHLHLESTMVNPQVLIAQAAKHGTTTFIPAVGAGHGVLPAQSARTGPGRGDGHPGGDQRRSRNERQV